MKKIFSVILIIIMLLPIASAGSEQFTSLAKLQQYIENHSPAQLLGPQSHRVQISGTILDIRFANQSNHYDMTLQVDDPDARRPIGYDAPVLNVHFRLHVDPIPFQVGDLVEVSGSLNSLYSSVMIPYVLAETINGSDDF